MFFNPELSLKSQAKKTFLKDKIQRCDPIDEV